jgi:outer membrane protein assembly factor BamB
VIAVTQTSDGGFGIAGVVPYTPGAADLMVMKLDANGNIQWQKRLGTTNSDNATGIIEDNHGSGAGLIVGGNMYSGTAYDAVITKLNLANGDVMWTKAYDFDGRANWPGIIYKVSDGLVFDVLNADGFGSDNAKVGILKTDFDGNVIWLKEFIIPNCRDARTPHLICT